MVPAMRRHKSRRMPSIVAIGSPFLFSYCPAVISRPSLCECSHNRSARPTSQLPRCTPTAHCHRDANNKFISDTVVADDDRVSQSTILLVYGFNASRVRYWYRPDPFRSYLNALRLISRVIMSLRDVDTKLPIHLLLSGERQPAFEAALVEQFGVSLLDAPEQIKIPKWSSPFHWMSFVKCAVLSLTRFRRVLVLDTDVVAFRNIDHLALSPAPAFVYRYKCFCSVKAGDTTKTNPDGTCIKPVNPIWEMNSGVMVLKPDSRAHKRMLRLMNGGMAVGDSIGPNVSLRSTYVPSDPGDQSVWRGFYSKVHELPVQYNSFKKTRFANVSDWASVALLHDPDVHRSHRIPLKSVDARYRNVTKRAERFVHELCRRLSVKNRG